MDVYIKEISIDPQTKTRIRILVRPGISSFIIAGPSFIITKVIHLWLSAEECFHTFSKLAESWSPASVYL